MRVCDDRDDARGSSCALDICEPMDDAIRLFNKVFFALTGTWADTFSFRRIVLAGVAEAQRQLPEENARWFDQFVNDPTNDAVFLDRAKYLETVGGGMSR